jgi:drug/metabolite transporter (DMT)-like permease
MHYGPLLIFVAAVLWGIDGVLRRTLFDLPPATIVFYEHLIGLILLSPFLIRAWKKEMLTRLEWGAITLVALLSGVLGTLFFTTALLAVSFIPFSVVFLLQKLQPIFTVTTAALVLKERVRPLYVVFAGIALIAGFFVTFPNGQVNFAEGGAHVVAAVFALLAAIAWGSSTAFSRYTLLGHDNTFVTGLRFLLTVPIALVFVFALGAGPSLGALTLSHIWVLLLIAVSTGMLALWIYYRGLRTTPASVATIIELAFPLTAIAIDFFVYDTALAPSQYTAAFVLLVTMYAIARFPLVKAA